jgi:TonB family protein
MKRIDLKKKYTLSFGIVIAIIINIIVFLLLPYLTELSSKKNLSSDLITPSKISVISPKKICNPYKKNIINKSAKFPKKKPKKIKKYVLSRNQKNIFNKKVFIKETKFLIDTKFSFGPKISKISLVTNRKQNLPLIEETANIKLKEENIYTELGVDEKPRLKFKIKPVFPYFAKEMELEGFVEIEFVVNENGSTVKAFVIKSKPEKVFDESALNTISKWKFYPAKVKGIPVKCKCTVKINFQLQ